MVPREDDIPIDAATGGVASPASNTALPPFAFVASRVRATGLSTPAPDWLLIAAIVLSLTYDYIVPSPLLSLPGLLALLVLAWLRLDLVLCLLPLTFPFWFVPKRVAGSVVFPLSEIALAVCVAVALARPLWQATWTHIFTRRTRPKWLGLIPLKQHLRLPSMISRGPSVHEPAIQGPAPVSRAALSTILSRLRLAGTPILIGAALLLLGTALGVLIARRPHEALRAFRWEVAEPLLYAALILSYLRRRHVRLLIGAFLGAALLLAALAAVQVVWLHVTFLPIAQNNRLIPYTTPAGAIPRATAFIFGSGNTLGAWMARALPLALALTLAPRGLPGRWRLLALAVALACVPALLWSDSRGALIAAAIACAVVVVLSLPRPRLALGLSAAATLGVLVVLLANRAAVLRTLLTGHNGSGEVRTLVWIAAWHMLRDHPLLGIGPDQFLYYYSSLYTTHPYWIFYQNGHKTLAWTEPNLAQPHNLFLDLWLSGGFFALAGFLLVLAAFWRACFYIWRPASLSPLPAGSRFPPQRSVLSSEDGTGAGGEGSWRTAVTLGLAASVLAGILHGMVDSAYFEPDLALLFWWSVATLIVLIAPEIYSTAKK